MFIWLRGNAGELNFDCAFDSSCPMRIDTLSEKYIIHKINNHNNYIRIINKPSTLFICRSVLLKTAPTISFSGRKTFFF